ncbi:hypothetical protein [Salinimicrobium gaetbulicola]|uniref:Uncharacterized protein n=1 Tax=Salinimicrobium gaetbulicola TaxID=999702 RepID=A0ABW3IHG9_9FLAO
MSLLTQIWSEKTNDFTTTQKAVLGLTVAFIFSTSFIALILLAIEFAK